MHPDTLEQSNMPENASLTILENSPQFSNAATRFWNFKSHAIFGDIPQNFHID